MAVDLTKLNTAQKEAVTHRDGPALLVAGAGTGKTTVITNRIAWLIAQGIAKPEEILAVTFTEKAAAEMEERVDRLLPLGYADLWIHTFHAFCQRILTDHALDIGVPNEFKVLDTTATWLLVREHLNRFDLDYYRPLGNPTKFIHALVQHFSRCKDEGVYPQEYLAYAESSKLDSGQTGDREAVTAESGRLMEIANAYHTYQQLLLDERSLDFGDLINYALKLFTERPAILKKFREQFKYLLVDEFQDTNWAQYALMKLLAAPKNNLMVVGDDDQSIYKFRGASFSNILLFSKDYPDAQKIYLTDNYRSSQPILDRAYAFIRLNNPDRLEVKLSGTRTLSKKLKSHSAGPHDVSIVRFRTADDEVRGVLEKIDELKKEHDDFSWNDVAILVRANDQAQRFVRAFRSLHVPHQFLASKGLYSQDCIMAILSYLKLLDNYHESAAFYKILTLPVWSLAPADIVNLTHLASKKSWSLWHATEHHAGNAEISDATAKNLQRIRDLAKQHTTLAQKLAPSVLIYRFLEDSGYLEYLTREDTQYTREQMLYLNQFYKKVRAWEEEHLEQGVKEFVDYLNLELESGDAGTLEQDIEEGPETITVSTIHGAKGLEYRFVFVVGAVHLRFPSRERKDPIELPEALIKDVLPEGDAHLQEERRLMYVALTRAKERVFITYAEEYGGAMKKKPSRFIGELGFDPDIPHTAVKKGFVASAGEELPLAKISYKLPAKFSFTQLKAFETCPKQYYYAHIIKIPAAGRAVFSFGKIMHAVLEKFFRLVQERAGKTQGELFRAKKSPAAKQPVSQKELLKLYEDLWEEDWFFDAEHKKRYYDKGMAMLKAFYEGLGGTVPVPVALEQPFTMKIGNASIKGVIDRVDEEKTDGSWKLIDYKTGSPPKDGKLTFDDKQQLLLYQIAAKEVFGKNVSTLTLYFLDGNQPIGFLGSEKEIAKLRTLVSDTIEAIRQSDFSPTPGFWCQSCDYRYICPAAQR